MICQPGRQSSWQISTIQMRIQSSATILVTGVRPHPIGLRRETVAVVAHLTHWLNSLPSQLTPPPHPQPTSLFCLRGFSRPAVAYVLQLLIKRFNAVL